MKSFTASAFFLTGFLASAALANTAYTSCVLDMGKAKGYIYSNSAMEYSGVSKIFFFNSEGELFQTKDFGPVSGRLDSQNSELLVETANPSQAKFCNFVIESSQNPNPVIPIDGISMGVKYSSQCALRDGDVWFSYIQNKGQRVKLRSVAINFLDSSGHLLGSQKVTSQKCLLEAQRLGYDKAALVPAGATSCQLAIDAESINGCN